MPSWFKPLVNKVIREGEEVSGDLERVITHKTKLPESQNRCLCNTAIRYW